MKSLEEIFENSPPAVAIGCAYIYCLFCIFIGYCAFVGTLAQTFTEAAAGFVILAVSIAITCGRNWVGGCGVQLGRQIRGFIRLQPRIRENPSTASVRLAALGAQAGAFLLPGLLFPSLTFHGEIKISYFVVILPSRLICAIASASVGGALLGAVLAGAIVSSVEIPGAAPPEAEADRPSARLKALASLFLFQLLHKVPQVFLAFMLAMEGSYSLEDRWHNGVFVLGVGLLYFTTLVNPGIETYLALSKRRLPASLLAPLVYTGGAWLLGGFLAWRLCGGPPTVQAILDHKILATPWVESKLFLKWATEGLAGAYGLSLLVAYNVTRVPVGK